MPNKNSLDVGSVAAGNVFSTEISAIVKVLSDVLFCHQSKTCHLIYLPHSPQHDKSLNMAGRAMVIACLHN